MLKNIVRSHRGYNWLACRLLIFSPKCPPSIHYQNILPHSFVFTHIHTHWHCHRQGSWCLSSSCRQGGVAVLSWGGDFDGLSALAPASRYLCASLHDFAVFLFSILGMAAPPSHHLKRGAASAVPIPTGFFFFFAPGPSEATGERLHAAGPVRAGPIRGRLLGFLKGGDPHK